MINVVVVDDQPLVRAAVCQILASYPDIAVVGEAADGTNAVRELRRTRADVVVMDIQMPDTDGIEATKRIRSEPELSGTAVLILTTFENDENVAAALRAGANGFIGKTAQPEKIAEAVRVVHAGDAVLSPMATTALVARYLGGVSQPGANGPRLSLHEPLTPRESEVLHLVAQGLSNQDIARQLVISVHTAKTHVNRIMVKLDARTRTDIVVWAYETGFIVPPSVG